VEFINANLNYILIAIGVLVLLLLIFLLFKLFGSGVRGRRGSRLGISEYYEIDKARRLVLVRRDDMEHLLLIGGSQDVVVESDIGSPLTTAESAQVTQMRQPPRPAVFGGRRPPLRPIEGRQEPEM
jgi:hypothetical protein